MIREIYRSKVKDTTINVINSKIESIRNKNIEKTGHRIYKDGLIGVAGAIGAYSEEELNNEALAALDKKIEYPVSPSSGTVSAGDYRTEIISPERFKEEVDELLSSLRERQPDYIFSNKISLTEVYSSLTNNEGLSLEYYDRSIGAGLIFKEKTSSNVMDGAVGFHERKFDRRLILDEFDLFLNAYKEKVTLPKSGQYPIIFMSYDTPCDKLVSDLHADVFIQGGSIFSGKTGQKLFNESFTFGQNLSPDKVISKPFFDAEGITNKDYTFNLIENGVLKAPYCDKKTAHKYGLTPTGCAASSYDGVPQTSLLNPYIKQTSDNLISLLGGQPGIMVLMAAGGDFTPQGDYATPVQLGMLFDGNRLVGRLPEFSLSSNIYKMFGEGFRGVSPNTFLPFSKDDLTVIEMDVAF